jgi:hypothetical protein
VYDAVDSTIIEMDHPTDDLRIVSREHGVCVANVVTYVDGRYVHMSVMTRASDH